MSTLSAESELARLQREIPEITPAQTAAWQQQTDTSSSPLLIDVREANEVEQGSIPGALHISRGFLELRIAAAAPAHQQPIICVCASGRRSLFAAATLKHLGYTDVRSMVGGYNRWQQEGLPTTRSQSTLGEAQRRRYARHISMPQIGEAGQQRLLKASVMVVGAGGLGSPAAFYLAAAGVGHIGIVDNDIVDESNLQRQILHNVERLGIAKSDSARRSLLALNPQINVEAINQRLTSENAAALLKDYDIIIDGSDNFPTHYLVSDTCLRLKKPCVHGSVLRFEGQVTVFHPPHGPCYRCLYPEPPPAAEAPSCAEAGVLGVLPGVIGMLQANEAIKLILGIGTPLTGTLLHYNALKSEFRSLNTAPEPNCRYCAAYQTTASA